MFELFQMEENEIIVEMITRFIDITNSLVTLGKTYTQVEMVRKVLWALTSEWEKKTTVIEEANDLSTLTLENLIRNLIAYEVQLQERKKAKYPKKKVLAFKVSSNMEDSDEEEEYCHYLKEIQKILEKK